MNSNELVKFTELKIMAQTSPVYRTLGDGEYIKISAGAVTILRTVFNEPTTSGEDVLLDTLIENYDAFIRIKEQFALANHSIIFPVQYGLNKWFVAVFSIVNNGSLCLDIYDPANILELRTHSIEAQNEFVRVLDLSMRVRIKDPIEIRSPSMLSIGDTDVAPDSSGVIVQDMLCKMLAGEDPQSLISSYTPDILASVAQYNDMLIWQTCFPTVSNFDYQYAADDIMECLHARVEELCRVTSGIRESGKSIDSPVLKELKIREDGIVTLNDGSHYEAGNRVILVNLPLTGRELDPSNLLRRENFVKRIVQAFVTQDKPRNYRVIFPILVDSEEADTSEHWSVGLLSINTIIQEGNTYIADMQLNTYDPLYFDPAHRELVRASDTRLFNELFADLKHLMFDGAKFRSVLLFSAKQLGRASGGVIAVDVMLRVILGIRPLGDGQTFSWGYLFALRAKDLALIPGFAAKQLRSPSPVAHLEDKCTAVTQELSVKFVCTENGYEFDGKVNYFGVVKLPELVYGEEKISICDKRANITYDCNFHGAYSGNEILRGVLSYQIKELRLTTFRDDDDNEVFGILGRIEYDEAYSPWIDHDWDEVYLGYKGSLRNSKIDGEGKLVLINIKYAHQLTDVKTLLAGSFVRGELPRAENTTESVFTVGNEKFRTLIFSHYEKYKGLEITYLLNPKVDAVIRKQREYALEALNLHIMNGHTTTGPTFPRSHSEPSFTRMELTGA